MRSEWRYNEQIAAGQRLGPEIGRKESFDDIADRLFHFDTTIEVN
jgi:hypothetical protein